MELFGCGFNADGQLTDQREQSLSEFESIATGTYLRVLFVGWGQTILLVDDEIRSLGHEIGSQTRDHGSIVDFPSSLTTYWGDAELLGAISKDGHVYQVTTDASQQTLLHRSSYNECPRLGHLAWTHAGRIAVTLALDDDESSTWVLQFRNINDFVSWHTVYADESLVERRSDRPGRPKQFLGGATVFMLLMQHGAVYTWGDARHPQCLGRAVSAAEPAERPNPVARLEGLYVKKIAVHEGWICAALTEQGEVYLWGDTPQRDLRLVEALCDQCDENGEDEGVKMCLRSDWDAVEDMDVGYEHVAVLVNGSVYVAGRGAHGQLGLGRDVQIVREWTEVESLKDLVVTSVQCSRWNTFAWAKSG